MVTKKVRTEYMKKFKDPKWETFSKCYEDSLKYRLTRRVMEHSHKPWFWEGWDSGSDSSGWSTPRLIRNKVAPLSLPPPTSSEINQRLSDLKISLGPKPAFVEGEIDAGTGEEAIVDVASPTEEAAIENVVNEATGGSETVLPMNNGDTATDNGPVNSTSDDDGGGELANPAPRRRRTPRSEPGHREGSHDGKLLVVRKPLRAKSQPAISTNEKENRRPSSRLDWTRRTPNDSHTSDACVQTRRQLDKHGSNPERRRARSADLEKTRRSQLTVADDHWMTEYMRCFSARLR
ncbi:unnamed protein product [Ophioblennius macclurei]